MNVGRAGSWLLFGVFCASIPFCPTGELQAGKARVKFKRGISDAAYRPGSFPATAPRTYAKVAALRFPDARRLFALNIKGKGRGRYKGPDGGPVIIYGNGVHTWRRRDGAIIIFHAGGRWTIRHRRHFVSYNPRHPCGPALQWIFPDRSGLRRCSILNGAHQRHFYKRDWPDGSETGFQIFAPGYWVKNHAKIGRFRFHYTDNWKDFIEAYRLWRVRDNNETRFFATMARLFNFKHRGEIPVMLVDNAAQKRAAGGPLHTGRSSTGGYNEIMICCGNQRKPYSRDPAVRRVQMRVERFSLLLHETVHNLQQHACRVIQRDGGRGMHVPANWFVEGVAEYGSMLFEKRARAVSLKRFERMRKAGRLSNLSALNPSSRGKYVGGRGMIDYMILKFGARSIRVYHESACGGRRGAAAMRAATGRTPEQVHRGMLAHFIAKRASLRAEVRRLELDGLPILSYVAPAARRRLPAAAPTVFAVKAIPDPASAFALDVSAYRFKYHGVFRDPAGRRVVLYDNGQYQIRGKNFKAAFWPDGRRAIQFGRQRIFVWKNGHARWTLASGESAYFDGEKISYYDARRRLIEEE